MTKNSKIQSETTEEIAKSPRKLNKKEREDLERQLNQVLGEVVDSIEAGHIQAPWWRQTS